LIYLQNSGGKSMHFLTVLTLLLSMNLVRAQTQVEAPGSGKNRADCLR
jgi:hypothetical protein